MSKYKPYSKYKESGVAWLGEVPEGWEISKLRFIFSFNKGLTITKAHLKEKGIPCVNYGEIHSKYGFEVSSEKHELKCVDSEYLITSKSSLLSKGDFVFADTSEDIEGAGNFTHLSGETQIFAGYHTIIGRQINEHNFRFLAYLIDSEAFRMQVRLSVKGVKVFSITQVILKNCIVWLPKIKEQKNISNYLDQKTQKIDTLIEKQQTLIKLLKEKRQALISHAVTKGLDDTVNMKDSGVAWLGEVPEHWEINKLRFIFSFNKGLTITKANLREKGIPCVNYGEIHSKYGFEVSAEKHELKCVDPEYLSTSKSSLLSKGDFVFADTSEDIEGAGNFTHLSGETQVFAGYHTIIARQISKHDFRFLAYLIDSEAFRMQIRLSVKGVKVFSITQFILKNCIVWLPEIKEQKNIAQYLDQKTKQIDTLISKSTQAIELLKERRSALISAVVTGKVDVSGEAL